MASKRRHIPKPSTVMRGLICGGVNKWLYRHRRSILAAISKDGRILSWSHFIDLMEADGVTRPSGKPITPKSLADAWTEVSATIKREEAHKINAAESKAPRRRRPNVEPPSRPGDNRPVHGQGVPRAEAQPDWRERHARQETNPPLTRASTPQPVVNAGRPGEEQPYIPQSAAEQLIELEKQMRKADGFQPTPRKRGRII